MELKEILNKAHTITESPYDYIMANSVSDSMSGAKYFGFNCIYAPEEILHAAGFVPVRLFGLFKEINRAEKYIPAHCCELAKSIISAFDSKIFDFLKGALFPFCCDTMQVASNIISERFDLNVFFINIPARLSGEASLKYTAELFVVALLNLLL